MMKKLFILLLMLLGTSVLGPQSFVWAAFEDNGTGARLTALGGAYQGMLDDAQSLMYNPAGLAQVRQSELTTEYAKLYTGLSDGSNLSQFYMGYAQPVRGNGTVGFGWKEFSLDNLYTERTLSLGYGEWITDNVAWGFAAKQLYHSIASPGTIVDNAGNVQTGTPDFFVKNGNSKSVYSGDLGVLVKATQRHTLSLSIQDFNEPNIALSGSDHDIVARTVRAGWSYKANRGLTWAAGLTSHEGLPNQQDLTWTGGVEKWWISSDEGDFALRGSLASGSREFQQMAMGSSYRMHQFQIDYAFVFNLTGVTPGATTGTHRFSLSYRFGRSTKPEPRVLKKRREETPEESAKREKELQTLFEMSEQEKAPPVRKTAVLVPDQTTAPVAPEQKVAGEIVPKVAPAEKVVPTAGVVPTVTVPPAPPTPPSAGMDQAIGAVGVAQSTWTPTVAPLAIIRTTPSESERTHSVQPSDLSVPLQNTPAPVVKPIVPLTRVQLLDRVQQMIGDYSARTAQKASGESRVQALEPIFDNLQGYLQGSSRDVLDYMSREDELNQQAKDYAAMKWDGASAASRMKALDRTLETNLTATLRQREWNAHDRRDVRYQAWLEQALAHAQSMNTQGASTHKRLLYWNELAQKAQVFELEPQDLMPITPAPVVKTPKSAPVDQAETPAEAKAAAQAAQGGDTFVYTVKEGDTLINLAERFYGTYKKWREIYFMNEDRLGRGGVLKPGQILVMPKKVKEHK